MKKSDKLLPTNSKPNSTLVGCPHCGSDQVWRLQRSETEKIICYLSKGEYAIKKYLCKACNKSILMHANENQFADQHMVKEEEGLILIFVPCSNCGSKKLKVGRVTHIEQSAYHTATGKTAYRKISCLNCNSENIISAEDFDEFNRQDF